MKHRFLLLCLFIFSGISVKIFGQTTTCPAPNPGAPNCYQTSRPSNGNALTNWPPIPNQDCCNAIPLCKPLNLIENGVVIPQNAPSGVLYPGCVDNELPNEANTCFSNNEKGTTWYKWQIRPLPFGPTAPGSPAGKLRFKIIPLDVIGLPNYDPFTDEGATGYGDTDYDFLLFKIPSNLSNDGQVCTRIRTSTAYGTANSVIASCNWTGTRGPTGLFEPGTGSEAAQGPAVRFNKPLDVKVGDVFYLAIDNFSVNQQGFFVDFRGLEAPDDSTAIVNPPPDSLIAFSKLESPQCASKQFKMIFSRPVRCDSVTPEKFIVNGLDSNIIITSIQPEGGCNSGGQDTSFIFTISPDDPDTTLSIIVASEIKDICGNKVLKDTAFMRIEYPVPLVYSITGDQPSCGTPEITVQFAKKVYCDSLRPSKFKVLFGSDEFGRVIKVRRKDGLCSPGLLDSIYVLTLSRAVKDSMNLKLVLTGIVRDKCNNPVENDTLAFRINPFLTLSASKLAVCPNIETTITAQLDSTFPASGLARDSITIRWTNMNTGIDIDKGVQDDIERYSVEDRNFIYEVFRDLVQPQTIDFRAIVTNRYNGCIDTGYISILFSAKPVPVEKGPITACFGESFEYKQDFSNAKRNELVFSWLEKGKTDTLSKDSVFSLTVTETLLQGGNDRTYVVNARYIDTLGGCKADPIEFKAKYGRKIEPQILIDSAEIYASIVPADYSFGNGSTFTPPKNNAYYVWDFGDGSEIQDSRGVGSAEHTYKKAGKNGAPFLVTLKAVDTLFLSPSLVGKICENRDSVNVFVQDLIPSLVTSNRDGKNDFFAIEGMRPNTFSMKLYNRWGKEVGSQDPFDNVVGWDPDKVGPGIYYYILTEKRSGKNRVGWLTITQP
jgi:hypothetical protein